VPTHPEHYDDETGEILDPPEPETYDVGVDTEETLDETDPPETEDATDGESETTGSGGGDAPADEPEVYDEPDGSGEEPETEPEDGDGDEPTETA
jgi:hypothetical protein